MVLATALNSLASICLLRTTALTAKWAFSYQASRAESGDQLPDGIRNGIE